MLATSRAAARPKAVAMATPTSGKRDPMLRAARASLRAYWYLARCHSDLKRGPQLQQLIALFHRHPAHLVRRGAGNFFFEIPKLRIEPGGVEFRQGDRLLREDGKARRRNLGETATHEETQFFCRRFVDYDDAWLHRRDQGSMILEDGEFAFRSRNDHGFDISRKDQLFGRNEFEVKSRHCMPQDVVSVAISVFCFCRGYPRARRRGPTLRRLGRELLRFFDSLFDGADHIESGFRQMIVIAFDEPLEALDGVGE